MVCWKVALEIEERQLLEDEERGLDNVLEESLVVVILRELPQEEFGYLVGGHFTEQYDNSRFNGGS